MSLSDVISCVGSGLPSMNYSSMGMMNTSTGSASPSKQEKNDQAPPVAPAATSTPMSPGASNLRYDGFLTKYHFFISICCVYATTSLNVL